MITFLPTSELTDKELMRQVNEFASKQAEGSSKLASERQKSVKVHACEIGKEEREARAKNATSDGDQHLLLEFRQIKSEINDLKDQVKGVKQKALTGVGHPVGAVGVAISQLLQVGVVRIASRGEEGMNVAITLLVVTPGMWLGSVTVTTNGAVNMETAYDFFGGTRTNRQQQ